mgnify:CR=1 FL=1
MGVLKNVKKAAAGKMAKMAQGMAVDKESAAPKNEKLDQLNTKSRKNNLVARSKTTIRFSLSTLVRNTSRR